MQIPRLGQICILCRSASRNLLCRACLLELAAIETGCSRCGMELPQPGICGACQNEVPAFDCAWAWLRYEGATRYLVQRMKFHGKFAVAHWLGEQMAQRLAAAPMPDALMPVPLHPQRLRSRGYNQALEMAKPLARRLDLPLLTRECRRYKPTAPQSELDLSQRFSNVSGAFQCRPLGLRHVAIVDDIMTTKATADELARCLKSAGVAKVSVWLAARA